MYLLFTLCKFQAKKTKGYLNTEHTVGALIVYRITGDLLFSSTGSNTVTPQVIFLQLNVQGNSGSSFTERLRTELTVLRLLLPLLLKMIFPGIRQDFSCSSQTVLVSQDCDRLHAPKLLVRYFIQAQHLYSSMF